MVRVRFRVRVRVRFRVRVRVSWLIFSCGSSSLDSAKKSRRY